MKWKMCKTRVNLVGDFIGIPAIFLSFLGSSPQYAVPPYFGVFRIRRNVLMKFFLSEYPHQARAATGIHRN